MEITILPFFHKLEFLGSYKYIHMCFNFFFATICFFELSDIVPYRVYIHKSRDVFAFSCEYSLTVMFEICFCKFKKENAFKNAEADDKAEWS